MITATHWFISSSVEAMTLYFFFLSSLVSKNAAAEVGEKENSHETDKAHAKRKKGNQNHTKKMTKEIEERIIHKQ